MSERKEKSKEGIPIAIIGVAGLLLLSSAFSGCIETSTDENGDQPKDTDGDGYSDNKDDFPNDPNLHKKTVLVEEKWVLISPKGYICFPPCAPMPHVNVFKIFGDIKYVEWNYSTLDENADITFNVVNYVKTPEGYELDPINTYIYSSKSSHEHHKINITSEKMGYWRFDFNNYEKEPVVLRVYIFMVE